MPSIQILQAYGLDGSDPGTAGIAAGDDAPNPLAPGAKIDAFNCDADGQGYVKAEPSSCMLRPGLHLSEQARMLTRCTPCEGYMISAPSCCGRQ